MNFGNELILDLQGCERDKFEREHLAQFFRGMCSLLEVERGPLHFWDYEPDVESRRQAPQNLAGVSAVQFISTSNITLHTLDHGGRVYLNIFSCGVFSAKEATEFCLGFFGGEVVTSVMLARR